MTKNGFSQKVCKRLTAVIVFAPLTLAGSAVPASVFAQDGAASTTRKTPAHMTEALRESVTNVVVLPTSAPSSGFVTGSYQDETDGFFGGANKGGRIGEGVSTDVGGVTVRYPIPILTWPGRLIGGLAGTTKRRIQDFRDRLTEDLAQSASDPLSNDALASDVFWSIRNVPSLKPKVLALTTPIPPDTEAILFVNMTGVGINVEDDIATITTTAQATLQRTSDGVHLYESEVEYTDTDTLTNWSKDGLAAWHAYSNYARHYIGREISARVFERVELEHTLRPAKSTDIKAHRKDIWRGTTKSTMPMLAWDLKLLDNTAYADWAAELDQSTIRYDVEVYDSMQMVYYAHRVQGEQHEVEVDLEPCKTYRWTVRPVYIAGTDLRFGEWMRFESDAITGRGNTGIEASAAAAYIQDFASLEVRCGRR